MWIEGNPTLKIMLDQCFKIPKLEVIILPPFKTVLNQ